MKKQFLSKHIQNEFSIKDAAFSFLNVLIWPTIFLLIFSILLVILSVSSGTELNVISESTFVQYVSQISTQVVFLVSFLIYSHKRKINIFAASKLHKKIEPFKVAIVIFISFISIFGISPFISLVDYLFGLIGFLPNTDLPFALKTWGDFLWAFLIVAVLPPIVEELIFRGAMLRGLLTKLTPTSAILWSALFFMLMHGSLQQTVYQFILGIMLAVVAFYTGNLAYSILLHFLNNFIVLVNAFYATRSGLASQVPVYATFMDYALPVLLFVVSGFVIAMLLQLLRFGGIRQVITYYKLPKEERTKYRVSKTFVVFKSQPDVVSSDTIVIEVGQTKKGFKHLPALEKKMLIITVIAGVVLWIIKTALIW